MSTLSGGLDTYMLQGVGHGFGVTVMVVGTVIVVMSADCCP